ncbi:uncharacterized protein LOC132636538 isoform X4 [Lycium barbarum]|uniref:uncharacterized protein LOC132636538 isoform X4 n=1 Tax=Lycium barbarum TaxID=112863 RepID=UPI00293E3D1A|nr:uncharacterized protein LOC132636538 isoform X4 [Lycium barbarum]XP_060209478.1 uncharacterized protein LOC132636538 isoform X4 [Lycium barbarum]
MILGANLVHKSKKDRVHKSKKDPTVVCEKSNESNKHGVLSLIGNHEDQLVSLQYFKHLFWRLEFTSKDIGFEDFMQVDKYRRSFWRSASLGYLFSYFGVVLCSGA